MDINQFSIYSIVSKTSEDESLENVLKLIEDFKLIPCKNFAKEYLRKCYKINDPVQNFPLGGNSFMDIEENNSCYTITFKYEHNSITYSYKK